MYLEFDLQIPPDDSQIAIARTFRVSILRMESPYPNDERSVTFSWLLNAQYKKKTRIIQSNSEPQTLAQSYRNLRKTPDESLKKWLRLTLGRVIFSAFLVLGWEHPGDF